jgi:flavodoxin I
MKAVVIYDSFFGNTEKVAKAIGGALGSPNEVSVSRISETNLNQLQDLELLIIGSPTRAFSSTPAIKAFVKKISGKSLEGVRVSAFDTRMKIDEKTPGILRFFAGIFGYAAKPILDGLVKKGGNQVMPAEGFFVVGSEGPLADGELDRAAQWAKSILKS